MKYTYRFVNGETRTIEVSEEQYRMLTDEDRLEYNNNQTNMTRTGRFVSLDMVQDEEGMTLCRDLQVKGISSSSREP